MKRLHLMLFFTLALAAIFAWAPQASAFQNYFTTTPNSANGNCVDCHSTQTTATSCAMCHAHGAHSSTGKTDMNLVGQTVDAVGVPKTSYAPGETVFVKITGGYRAGSARILLYDQGMAELARSSGSDGMNNAPSFNNTAGVTLSSAAPTTPGMYMWNAAWYGNQNDRATNPFFGQRWTPDPNNFEHGQEIVATNAFTVTTPAAPIIGVSPTTLAFGTVTIGVPTTLPVTIANTGTAPLNVTGIALGAGTSTDFSWAPPAPFTVAAGGSTTLNVTFTPTSAGAKTGSIVISSNDTATPTVAVNVSGTGAVAPAPVIALTPPSLAFGTVSIGAPSTLTAQIQNNGTANLVVSGIALCAGTSAEFSFVQIAPVTITPGTSAVLSVTYAPTNIGPDTGCIAISSNDPVNGTINLNLTGTGAAAPTPGVTLAPNPLAFGTVTIGTPATLTAQIQSTGTAPLTVTGIALCAGTTEFSFAPIALPVSIPVGGNLPLNVTYLPATVGPVTGCITITSDAPAATLNLTGTGAATPQPVLSVAPTTLTFGNQQVGTSSAPQQVTISNTGTAAMTGVSVSSSSAAFVIGGAPTATVAAGGSTTFTVAFAPTSAGAASATITVATTNAGSAAVSASGTGTSAANPTIVLVPNPLAFGTVTIGNAATLTATIQNTGTANLVVNNIALCAGTTAEFSFVQIAPVTIIPGASANLSVTYAPTNVGADSGCLDISSNDPVTPIAQLDLNGSGQAPVVRGDVNSDGIINRADVNFIMGNLNKPVSVCPACDLDGDGKITILDARKDVLLCTNPGCR